MSSMDSSAPAICRLRTTPPISISASGRNLSAPRLVVTGCTLSSMTVSEWSPPRSRPASIRHFAASTSAIETPFGAAGQHGKMLRRLAQTARRGRGRDRLPSALSVMRSFGLAGTTVISPSGEEIFACASSQPASMVSASGTATAKRPAALSTRKAFGEAGAGAAAILRRPRRAAGRLRSAPATAALSSAVLVAIDGLGVGEIGENLLRGLGDNVLTLRHSVPRC